MNKYANDIPVRYTLTYEVRGKKKGASGYTFLRDGVTPQAGILNSSFTIKLPSKAEFVGSNDNYVYDSASHTITKKMENSYFRNYTQEKYIDLVFRNMQDGEQISWPQDALTITGME